MKAPTHVGIGLLALVIFLAAGCGAPDTRSDEPAAATAPAVGDAAKSPPDEGTAARPPRPSGEGFTGRSGRTPPRPPADIAPARFEATVYEVQVPENRLAELDAQALAAKAGNAEDLRKALADFGPTKVLYKVDQPVNLYSESIVIGSRVPFVTNSRATEAGGVVNTIQYQQVGVIFQITAALPPKESKRKGLDVRLNTELSAMVDSPVAISPGAKAVTIRSVSFSQSQSLQYGRPIVALNLASPARDEKAPPVAYVIRYVFTEVKP